MTTTAIYIRVSTPGQAEDGFGANEGETNPHYQLAECRDLAARFNLDVPADLVITEQASGAYIERDGLDRLRDLIRTKQIGAVVMWKTDRIARDEDLVGQLLVLNEAKRAGVTIYTSATGGPVDTTMQGNLVNVINAYVAAAEKDTFRLRSMSGKRSKARNENVLPVGTGVGIYGYDYMRRVKRNKQTGEPGSPPARVINETEASVVRRMFGMALEGLGLNTIAVALNREGIRSKTGGQWHPRTVGNVLRNPAYTGVTRYGVTATKLLARGKREMRKRDEAEVLQIEGWTPPIIDQSMFDRVQAHLDRPRRSGHAHEPYLLSGMLKCTCGTGLVGQKLHRGKYRYYVCRGTGPTATRPQICWARRRQMQLMDDAVWNVVTRILSDPDELYRLAVACQEDKPAVEHSVIDQDAAIGRLEIEESEVLVQLRSAASAAEAVRLSKRLEAIAAEKRRTARTRSAKSGPQTVQDDQGISRAEIEARFKGLKLRLRTMDVVERQRVLSLLGFGGKMTEDDAIRGVMDIPNDTDGLLTTGRTSA